MPDLSNFKRGQIVGARMAGASLTKTAELFGVARSTVLKVMTTFGKEGKPISLMQNYGRKRNMSDKHRWILIRIVRRDHKNKSSKITTELNDYLEKPVFRRGPWCNDYRRRTWTWRHEFKSWTRLIAFHIALIPLGKVWIQIFSLQLWVNSRADCVLQPWWGNYSRRRKSLYSNLLNSA